MNYSDRRVPHPPRGLGAVAAGLFLWVLSAAPFCWAGSPETRVYPSVGAGSSFPFLYRTEFYLANEGAIESAGDLIVFAPDGSALEIQVEPRWVGEGPEGTVQVLGTRVEFSIPAGLSLVLTLLPAETPLIGSAELRCMEDLASQVRLQVAVLPDREPTPSDFEHYVVSESEIFPGRGIKDGVFPVSLFKGLRTTNTAFSIVNLSGLAGTAQLTLRPGMTRSVVLEPGQAVSDYFDSFWELSFPEVFPFRMDTAVEVKSEIPIGISAFKTVDGLPVAGIRVVERPASPTPVPVELDQEFVLEAGQQGVFEEAELEILFWDVEEDTRCPIDVVCVQAGRAVVQVRVRDRGRNLGGMSLSTEAPGDVLVLSEFRLRLDQVEPSRVSTRQLEIGDYRLHLLLTREGNP